MYAKMKELGPVGGRAPSTPPPQIRQCDSIVVYIYKVSDTAALDKALTTKGKRAAITSNIFKEPETARGKTAIQMGATKSKGLK